MLIGRRHAATLVLLNTVGAPNSTRSTFESRIT